VVATVAVGRAAAVTVAGVRAVARETVMKEEVATVVVRAEVATAVAVPAVMMVATVATVVAAVAAATALGPPSEGTREETHSSR